MTFPVFNTGLIGAVQTAVGPAILISAAGLLLLTMTNRLGRTIDRARSLSSSGESSAAQIGILVKRSHLLRRAILFAVISALCASLLVILLFVMVLFDQNIAWFLGAIFIGCMASLVVSLVLLMRDVNLSLEALETKLKSGKGQCVTK